MTIASNNLPLVKVLNSYPNRSKSNVVRSALIGIAFGGHILGLDPL